MRLSPWKPAVTNDPFFNLPETLRASVLAYAALPLDDPETLRRKVRAHLAAARKRDPLHSDLPLAEKLAGVLDAELARLGRDTPESRARLIQAAARYFVASDDRDDDFASPFGPDDDEAVTLAALRHLDLVGDLRPLGDGNL
jgi:hypothetical protein